MPGFSLRGLRNDPWLCQTKLFQEQTPGSILATRTERENYKVWEKKTMRAAPMVPVAAMNMTDAVATHPTMQIAQPIPSTETMTSTEKPAASK